MRSLIASLTSAMLLVHAFAGCCRHHGDATSHCDQAACCDSLVVDCCHEAHETHDDCGEHPAPFGPCECKLECKSMCVSLPPQKTVLDAGPAVCSIDAVADAASTQVFQSSATAASQNCLQRSWAAEPPLRLHLLHQVILV